MNKNNIILQVCQFDASEFTNKPSVEDFMIRATINSDQVGYVKCYHESGRLYAFEVFVSEDYRRQGIATKMYNHAELISGKTIHPHHENPYNQDSDAVSDLALLFWKARRN